MASLPEIVAIQASDAPQHAANLRKILQKLETENRIRGFTELGPDDDLSSITDHLGKEDLILIVLTGQLEEYKTQIENRFKALKVRHPEAKVAEILIDNVVYANEFITFPADLRPIRDREDMDAAWNDIEQSLKNIFPVKEPEQESSEWFHGILEWPWESPGRWHGTLLALVVITVALSLIIPSGTTSHETTLTFQPMQCEEYVFGNTAEEIQAYFEEQEASLQVKRVDNDVMVCLACSVCPTTYHFEAVVEAGAENLLADGWQEE